MQTTIDKQLIREYVEEHLDELLEQHGNEFLWDHKASNALWDDDLLDEWAQDYLKKYSAFDLMCRAFYGYEWIPTEELRKRERDALGGYYHPRFNPNHRYWGFNAYNNLISVDECNYLDYLKEYVDFDNFVEWLIRNNHIDMDE